MTNKENYKNDLEMYANSHIQCGNDIKKLLEENKKLEEELKDIKENYIGFNDMNYELKVHKKALEISCKTLKQNNIQFLNNHIGIVTSHCEELEDEFITQTKDDIYLYLIEQARKELENGK